MGKVGELWATVNTFLVDNVVGVIIVGLLITFIHRPLERALNKLFHPFHRLLRDFQFVSQVLDEFERSKFNATCFAGIAILVMNALNALIGMLIFVIMDSPSSRGIVPPTIKSAIGGVIVCGILYSLWRLSSTFGTLGRYVTTIQATPQKIAALNERLLKQTTTARAVLDPLMEDLEAKARRLNLIV